MLITKTRIGGILLLAFCLAYYFRIDDIRLLPFQANQAFTPRTVPQVLAVLGIILSSLLIVMPGSDDKTDFRGLNWPLGLAFLGLMSVYGLSIRPMGFLISTSVFLIAGFALLGERNPLKLLAVSVPLVVAFWLLMNYGLSVFIEPLPFFLRG